MEYWGRLDKWNAEKDGFILELRARIALVMLEHWGPVMGKVSSNEDSSGRRYIEDMQPQDLVRKAFEIAKFYVERAEQDNLIKKYDSDKGNENAN